MNIVLLSNLRKLLPEISLLSLILSSRPLRKAPQKVLNEVYMTQDINQETDVDRVASSYLGRLEHLKQQKGLTLLGHKFHTWAL
jgi:hypothetical protein